MTINRSSGEMFTAITLNIESPKQQGVEKLIKCLDDYQRSLYPLESTHLLSAEELNGDAIRVVVARVCGRPVGCGALRVDASGYCEVKRVFVLPEVRGQNVGRKILEYLEQEARTLGASWLKLETGIFQPAALALYHKAGFIDCGPFGSYSADKFSLFLKKAL